MKISACLLSARVPAKSLSYNFDSPRAQSAALGNGPGASTDCHATLKRVLGRLVALFWMCSPTVGSAMGADPTYVAFTTVPGPVRSAPQFHVFLAEETCPTRGAPPQWKRAMYRYSQGDEPACWQAISDAKITICPVGQYETKIEKKKWGTSVSPCHELPKSRFTATTALPQQYQFAPMTTSNEALASIKEVESLNAQCRGGSGDSPKTMMACEKRDKLMSKVEKLGWCWGSANANASGAEKHWIKCK